MECNPSLSQVGYLERDARRFEMWKFQFWLETLIPWIFVWVDGRHGHYLWVARSLQFSLISVGESFVYFFCTRVVGLYFFCALLMNHLLGCLGFIFLPNHLLSFYWSNHLWSLDNNYISSPQLECKNDAKNFSVIPILSYSTLSRIREIFASSVKYRFNHNWRKWWQKLCLICKVVHRIFLFI